MQTDVPVQCTKTSKVNKIKLIVIQNVTPDTGTFLFTRYEYCTGVLVLVSLSECPVLRVVTRAWKIVTKFRNYSYEIVMSPVIVNSCKNVHNSYQIVK